MSSADKLKQEGNKAFAKLEFKKAAKIYRDAIKLAPGNPILYSNRALCFIRLQDWDRALKDCNDGLKLEGDDKTKTKLYYRKGLVLKEVGNFRAAKECFLLTVQLDPKNTAAHKEINTIEGSSYSKKRAKCGSSKETYSVVIQDVEVLPPCYQELIAEPQVHARDSSLMTSSEENIQATETFEKEKINRSYGTSNRDGRLPSFTERPSMHHLTALKNLDPKEKTRAYKYVLDMSSENYSLVFGNAGMEPEFLELLIEAMLYASRHDLVDNWAQKCLALLKYLSTVKRYDISLQLCSRTLIEQFLVELLKLNEPYKEYFEFYLQR